VDGEAQDVVSGDLDLAGVTAGSDLEPEPGDRLADGLGAAYGAAGFP